MNANVIPPSSNFLPTAIKDYATYASQKSMELGKLVKRVAEFIKYNYSFCLMIVTSAISAIFFPETYCIGIVSGVIAAIIINIPLMERACQEPHKKLYLTAVVANTLLAILIYTNEVRLATIITKSIVLYIGLWTGGLAAWKVLHTY